MCLLDLLGGDVVHHEATLFRLSDHRHLRVVPSDARHLHFAQGLLIRLQLNGQFFGIIRSGSLQRSGLVSYILNGHGIGALFQSADLETTVDVGCGTLAIYQDCRTDQRFTTLFVDYHSLNVRSQSRGRLDEQIKTYNPLSYECFYHIIPFLIALAK